MKIWEKKLSVCIATLNFTTLSKKILNAQNVLRAKWLNPKLIKKEPKKILDLFYYDGNTKIFSEQNIPLTIDEKIKLKLGWYIIELMTKKRKL